MEETVFQRLDEAINHLIATRQIRSAAEFAKEIKTPASFVSEARSGKKSITAKFAEKINRTFPSISIDWLLTGEGDMLIEDANTDTDISSNTDTDIISVPLLPISAQGGTLNDFVVSVKESECERVISPIKGADFAMTVSGDSMAPEYPSGSQIFIKKINEQAFIEWGKVYVLDTCNGSVIKILAPSDKEGFVKCLSINEDPKYASFEVEWNDIYGVYRVLLCMSLK